MGLAAPKKKFKVSHDPNNTKWTNDTQSFGRKIMISQGWKQGEYLGAKGAAHAEFHTAANASNFRAIIKDDNFGLGAKVGSGVGHGECTGLDAFKNLLNRLNGKAEDEILKEQRARDDIRRAMYTKKRWCSVRFVSAGFLVGDKIQNLIDDEAKRIRKLARSGNIGNEERSEAGLSTSKGVSRIEEPKKSKKRKADAIEPNPESPHTEINKPEKERSAEKSTEEDLKSTKTSKKRRKDSKSKIELEIPSDEVDAERRKQKRKHKKEQKRRKNTERDHENSERSFINNLKPGEKRESVEVQSGLQLGSPSILANQSIAVISLETKLGRSTSIMQGRHAVRSRNIAQKRLASMDTGSLNQIFMIRT